MKTSKRVCSPTILEKDLYPPLKAWLEKAGYTVHGEVAGCDVAAVKDEELILIELKKSINLDLVLQLVKRQQADAAVYAAVPAPKTVGKRWKELNRLLKRLEVGLILIYTASAQPRVELAFHPLQMPRRRTRKTTGAFLKEISGRSQDLNSGGSNKCKIMTAYREESLAVAVALHSLGDASPKELRQTGTSDKTGRILLDNHYGWFERISKGLYRISSVGREALIEYDSLAEALIGKLHLAGTEKSV